MKRYRYYFKLALLLILMTALLVTTMGCGSADSTTEVFVTEETPASARSNPLLVEDSVQRAYRTGLKGDGEDVVTLMVYMCGSDLESQGGAATLDLIEIMKADVGENLNIVVETGGANKWANNYVDPDLNQRWLATNEDLLLLESGEAKNMSKGSTLRDFISYSAENFPADRYMLVLWDHGGGTVDGYAYDERFGGYAMMSLSELNEALAEAGVVFDMIGFDCCLMSTAETAFMVEKYADYMVASQRVEPGEGWYYTTWIEALSRNTSIPTAELGALIVDSFINESRGGYYGNELTLAVTDLTYIPDLFDTMYGFFSEVQGNMAEDGMFLSTSKMLGGSRAMQSKYDLVDLAYLLESMDGSKELLNKLAQCVVYNGVTLENHNGLCLYFPYSDLGKVEVALDIYDEIGIDETYQNFIATFANMMLGGQVYNSGGGANPLGGDGFDLDYWLEQGWADEELWASLDGFFADNSYDDSELIIDEKGDEYVLSLSDEDWELITTVEQRIFLDDGEGYIDLGSDSVYEFDEDGDLLISFDNTWVSLDGQLACFYTTEYVYEDDDDWYNYGVVPIQYEDEEAELVIAWDSDNPEGYVAGWRYTYTGSGSQKGLFELWDGMYFDFLCDYYTYDGEYNDQYLWGGMTVDGPVIVSYEDVGDDDCMVYYELYDVYNNAYWTESVVYSLY